MPNKKVTDPEPFDKRNVDFTKFKTDLTVKDYQKLFSPKGGVIFPFFSIEILSPTKTIGKGRTNLTIIRPTIVQIDATVPVATFDRREAPPRKPAIQTHFQPHARRRTPAAPSIMQLVIHASGQSTFNLAGGPVPTTNGGTKVLNGSKRVSLVFSNLAPTQQVFGFLEQTAGVAWSWFSTSVSFPPIVVQI